MSDWWGLYRSRNGDDANSVLTVRLNFTTSLENLFCHFCLHLVCHDASHVNDEEDNAIFCVLACNAARTKFIVQAYLRASDEANLFDAGLKKTRKFFAKEVFKSDVYALVKTTKTFAKCFVVSLKDFLLNEIRAASPTGHDHVYICESMCSTSAGYMRKLSAKKWQPLKFVGCHGNTNINSGEEDETTGSPVELEMRKRTEPFRVERRFVDAAQVKSLMERVDKRLSDTQTLPTFFKSCYCETVQYDSPPARYVPISV